ncbi:phosphohexomutase domain-containing protein [Pectinatus sottacetonis]|uniref:phosphomannomutase/phosphoglucomutase n=1 Tax=Pectinatus sottacetonis TaxID=1002795 RepID=UPI0018C6E50D|nr:phosphomannomutase/phosphoglucomutase [Pectinatus sottacetonis]
MSEDKTILKLQNGSDVRGVAIEGVEGEPVTLTNLYANTIAAAFVKWLVNKLEKPVEDIKIAVGHDSRLSAERLKKQVLKAILGSGADAYDCGLATTPSMYMSLVYEETKYDGSIMITASHLPYNRNGLKFFTIDGGMEKKDLTDVLNIAAETRYTEENIDKVKKCDIINIYAQDLCEKIRKGINSTEFYHPLKGLHVVVDAGNGAGGFFVEKVLGQLGADISGSQFLEPDGWFPNHIPNPENKQAMEALRTAVVENKADLGLIFDTDVDRMSAVLSDGREIARDTLIAMMAAILAPDYPCSTIVTDSVTSDKLTAFLENELHLKHHRYMRGYKNVINECKRLNAKGEVSPLAIETSGHGALKENYYLDDGAYLAVKLLIAATIAKKENKSLESLIEKLQPVFEEVEYRMSINGEDFKEYGGKVLEAFAERARRKGYTVVEPSYEGVRLSFTGNINGWALLRQSLHDPKMPLNIEGNGIGDCDKITTAVRELLTDFSRLDVSVLKK